MAGEAVRWRQRGWLKGGAHVWNTGRLGEIRMDTRGLGMPFECRKLFPGQSEAFEAMEAESIRLQVVIRADDSLIRSWDEDGREAWARVEVRAGRAGRSRDYTSSVILYI